MNSGTIFDFIDEKAFELTPSDLDSIVEQLLIYFKDRIKHYNYDINKKNDDLAVASFTEEVRAEFKLILNNFLFAKKRHIYGYKSLPYLSSALLLFKKKKKKNIYKASFVCPICALHNHKEICEDIDHKLFCKNCNYKIKNDIEDGFLDLRKKYLYHSKKGAGCPECKIFIPYSLYADENVACPSSTCFFFGKKNELEKMSHPLTMLFRPSLTSNDKNDGLKDILADRFCNNFSKIESRSNEVIPKLSKIINDQIAYDRKFSRKNILFQKENMLLAYDQTLKKYPEDMVSYLIAKKANRDFPIQSKILQEYSDIVIKQLPVTIYKGRHQVTIFDPTDPDLLLFTGISVFKAVVSKDYTIPNCTEETFIGPNKLKNYGKCFIGKLIDIKDSNNCSIINQVIEYSFTTIKLRSTINPGTEVTVTHYRLLPHYEMGAMSTLQTVRNVLIPKIEKKYEF